LCEGQALDEQFEDEDDVTVERYLDMIDRKTGALLEAVLVLGGLVGGADSDARAYFAEAGRAFGRAFQIQDDLLDLTADDDGWGKTIGGDLMEGKKTFLLLRALESSEGDDRAWFRRIVTEGGLDAGEIDEARRRMDALGVLDEARREVLRHYDIGERALHHLPEGPGRDGLLWIAGRMAQRVR
jgi:geranylgeranyl diphosphate synthase type II